MAELDRFDRELSAAVQGFADHARTEVDAVAIATRAARPRRTGAWGWLDRGVTLPIGLLLPLGLLAILSVALAAGGWWPFRASVVPAVPTAAANLVATASPAVPSGQLATGSVSGTESVVLVTDYTSTPAGIVTELRGGVVSVTTSANDPRASGTGTFAFSADVTGGVAAEWGTYRLETVGGTWEGRCSGASWDDGNAANGTCWLVGSGAFAGYTYYRSYSWSPGGSWVAGVIYPNPPPEP